MQFLPQPEKEIRVPARQLVSPMNPHMAAPAQGDVGRRLVDARLPVVDHQRLRDDPRLGETGLATEVAGEDRFAVSGKVLGGATAAVITGTAQAAGDQRGAATRPAPPRRLSFSRDHASLLPIPVSTCTHSSGRPPSVAAASSRGSSQAALTEPNEAPG